MRVKNANKTWIRYRENADLTTYWAAGLKIKPN